MAAQFYLKITQRDGSDPLFVAQQPGGGNPTKGPFSNLSYTNVINGYGPCTFTLYGEHVAIAKLTTDALVEVWRSWPEQGILPYCDWSGIFKDEDSSYSTGSDLFNATCYGDNWWLWSRMISWYAGCPDRTLFSSARGEFIMKALVDYNLAANALLSNGRDEDAVMAGVTIEADGAHGNTLDWACANENLLSNLQKLAPAAGGDFDLVKIGTASWEFRWYTGQRGSDRSANVKFSIELGNMANPHYALKRSQEKTVALVKGLGTGVDRAVAIRQGANYSADNLVEVYVNASTQATTTATLNATGDAALKTYQATEVLEFDALPFSNTIYHKDWFLGDKVSAKYKAHDLTPRIVMVTVSPDAQMGEKITPGMAVNV